MKKRGEWEQGSYMCATCSYAEKIYMKRSNYSECWVYIKKTLWITAITKTASSGGLFTLVLHKVTDICLRLKTLYPCACFLREFLILQLPAHLIFVILFLTLRDGHFIVGNERINVAVGHLGGISKKFCDTKPYPNIFRESFAGHSLRLKSRIKRSALGRNTLFYLDKFSVHLIIPHDYPFFLYLVSNKFFRDKRFKDSFTCVFLKGANDRESRDRTSVHRDGDQ